MTRDDLPPAEGVIGDLARRLLAGDLTAFAPLLDALDERGRVLDVREVRLAIADLCRACRIYARKQPGTRLNPINCGFAERVERVLWFDLYDMAATLAAVEPFVKPRAVEHKPFPGKIDAAEFQRLMDAASRDARPVAVTMEDGVHYFPES